MNLALQPILERNVTRFNNLRNKLSLTRLQIIIIAAVFIVLTSWATATGVQHYLVTDPASSPGTAKLPSANHKKVKASAALAEAPAETPPATTTSPTTTTGTPTKKATGTTTAPTSTAPVTSPQPGTLYQIPKVTLTASITRIPPLTDTTVCYYTVTLKATAETTRGDNPAGVRLTLLTTHDDGPSQTNKSETYTHNLVRGETKYFTYNHSYYKGQNGTTVRASVQYASLDSGAGILFNDTTPTNVNSTDYCW